MIRRPPARGLPLAVRLLEALRRRPWDLPLRRQVALVLREQGHEDAARAHEALIPALEAAERRRLTSSARADMTDTITIRASRLSLAMACPGAVLGDGLAVDPVDPAAGLGTAVHEALRPLVDGLEPDWDGLPALARKHGADPDEARALVGMACRLWQDVADRYTGGMSEVEMLARVAPRLWLVGHADIVRIADKTIYVGDWKTGRLDSDYRDQVLAYCALALHGWPGTREAIGTLLWVRDGEVETYRLTREDLGSWDQGLADRILRWDGTYHPGDHCCHCPRAANCPARCAMARQAVAALEAGDRPADLTLWTPDELLALHARARDVAQLAKAALDALRAHVQEHGDVVGEGGRLTLETRTRREVDTLAAWDVLQDALPTDEALAGALKVSLGAAEKTIKSLAGKGKGAAAVREFRRALAEAGAITERESVALIRRRA